MLIIIGHSVNIKSLINGISNNYYILYSIVHVKVLNFCSSNITVFVSFLLNGSLARVIIPCNTHHLNFITQHQLEHPTGHGSHGNTVEDSIHHRVHDITNREMIDLYDNVLSVASRIDNAVSQISTDYVSHLIFMHTFSFIHNNYSLKSTFKRILTLSNALLFNALLDAQWQWCNIRLQDKSALL